MYNVLAGRAGPLVAGLRAVMRPAGQTTPALAPAQLRQLTAAHHRACLRAATAFPVEIIKVSLNSKKKHIQEIIIIIFFGRSFDWRHEDGFFFSHLSLFDFHTKQVIFECSITNF